jgi:hypothetical protein
MANKSENLERLLLTQKLIKAKLYSDLEDVVDKMVSELESDNRSNCEPMEKNYAQ